MSVSAAPISLVAERPIRIGASAAFPSRTAYPRKFALRG
ncbi:hypothetical protein BJY16_003988 [Actinoplanes octamycinicus]|uniref:Uncharacterized protein n=1 Tax=Actinoplanes octamycinicus TaxID=135948 RepID=A0A7W7GY94_9ACTN|nr:hypothetical protein [Actinoplanes octamycinicus]